MENLDTILDRLNIDNSIGMKSGWYHNDQTGEARWKPSRKSKTEIGQTVENSFGTIVSFNESILPKTEDPPSELSEYICYSCINDFLCMY